MDCNDYKIYYKLKSFVVFRENNHLTSYSFKDLLSTNKNDNILYYYDLNQGKFLSINELNLDDIYNEGFVKSLFISNYRKVNFKN